MGQVVVVLRWGNGGSCLVGQEDGAQGGFGSTMMIGAGRQLGGEIERTFGPRGVTVGIAFPPRINGDGMSG